jgi:hypothetical protein
MGAYDATTHASVRTARRPTGHKTDETEGEAEKVGRGAERGAAALALPKRNGAERSAAALALPTHRANEARERPQASTGGAGAVGAAAAGEWAAADARRDAGEQRRVAAHVRVVAEEGVGAGIAVGIGIDGGVGVGADTEDQTEARCAAAANGDAVVAIGEREQRRYTCQHTDEVIAGTDGEGAGIRQLASVRARVRRQQGVMRWIVRRYPHAAPHMRYRHEQVRAAATPMPRHEFFPTVPPTQSVRQAIELVAQRGAMPAAVVREAYEAATTWMPRESPAIPRPGTHPAVTGTLKPAAIADMVAAVGGPDVLAAAAYGGADLGYSGPRLSVYRDAATNAYGRAHLVDAAVQEGVALRHVLDVTELYEADPTLPIIMSMMRIVDKAPRLGSPTGKARIVHDATIGDGASANSFTHPALMPVATLHTCAQVAAAVVAMREARPTAQVLLQSYDIEKAYKAFPIRPACWWTMAFGWLRRVYWCTVVHFGHRAGGNWLVALVLVVVQFLRLSGVGAFEHVDDIITVAYAEDAQRADSAVLAACASVGLPVSAAKLAAAGPPSVVKAWCGWVFDTAAMTMAPDGDRLTDARMRIQVALEDRHVTVHQMQSISGKLMAISQGMPHMRAFLVAMRQCIPTGAGGMRHISLSAAAKADLRLWAAVLESYVGVSVMAPQQQQSAVRVYTDASTSGWGWWSPELQIFGSGAWPVGDDTHINVREGGVIALATASVAALGVARLDVWTDSKVARDVLEGHATGSVAMTPVLRAHTHCVSSRGIHAPTHHVPGVQNGVADGLSRGTLAALRAVSPDSRQIDAPPDWLEQLQLSAAPWEPLWTIAMTGAAGARLQSDTDTR